MKWTQGDLFKGLRFFTEPSGQLRLECTVETASKYTGLAPRTIHHYIEDGEIDVRQPGLNRVTDESLLTCKGRKKSFKSFLDIRDVFRLAYGQDQAVKLCEELGIEPKRPSDQRKLTRPT